MHNVSDHNIECATTQSADLATQFCALGYGVPADPRAFRRLTGNAAPDAQLSKILGKRLCPISFPLPGQWHWSIYEDPVGKCKHFGYFVEVTTG